MYKVDVAVEWTSMISGEWLNYEASTSFTPPPLPSCTIQDLKFFYSQMFIHFLSAFVVSRGRKE